MTKPLVYPGGVRVYDGARGHRVSWREDGQRRSAQRASKDEACKLAAEVSRRLADVEPAGADATLHTVADEYITVNSAAGDWSSSYATNERRNLDGWILPRLGDTPARLLTRADVADCVIQIRDGIKAESYTSQVLGTLRRTWAYGVRAGYIPAERKDWADMASKGRRTAGHSREFVDPSQRPTTQAVMDLIGVCKPNEKGLRAAIALGAFCGLRWGEMAALEPGDIDREAGIIKVQRQWVDGEVKLPKRGKVRETILPEPVVLPIMSAADETLDVVCSAWPMGGHWTPQAFSRHFLRLRKEAGWPEGWTFHSLRHHFASYLLDRHVPVEDVAMLMGHSSPDVTYRTYVSVAEGALERAREATRTL